MARIVIRNARFFGRAKPSALTIPWCIDTEPEIAHVGLYEKQVQEQGIEVDTFTRELLEVDRSILEGRTNGLVRVHVRKGMDKIAGASIVKNLRILLRLAVYKKMLRWVISMSNSNIMPMLQPILSSCLQNSNPVASLK